MQITHKAEHIYLHIPFCVKKCVYCDFCSVPHDAALEQRYMQALFCELALRAHAIGSVKTIFLGGGTPSILPASLLADIMRMFRASCAIEPDAEITLEANPATIDRKKCDALRSAGFNRISIGVQSGHEAELRVLGRIHGWNDVAESCEAARKAGFSDLSLDLMYGIPGQTVESWHSSLERVQELAPEHISAYELTPEADTPLGTMLHSGMLALPQEDDVAEMYFLADSLLGSKDYEHYEISNYAHSGYRCRHNMAYWQRKSYIGLGVAAHSFDGQRRTANIEDVMGYIDRMEQGVSPVAESIVLSSLAAFQEEIFLGLRTVAGVRRSVFSPAAWSAIDKALQSDTLQGLVETSSDCLRLTSRGWLVSNQVIASILSDTEKLRRE